MKNRITKTLRAKAGFTLVELIVVIAILGILAGVGTVGYSGYIKKANMAADEQLLGYVNTAFSAACLEKGVDAASLKDGSVTATLTDGKVTEVSEYNEEFIRYYGENSSAFKLLTALYFRNGMFAGAFEGDMVLNYNGVEIFVPAETVEAMQDSTYGKEIGAAKLLTEVAALTSWADADGNAILDVLGDDFFDSVAGYLGFDDPDMLDEFFNNAELNGGLTEAQKDAVMVNGIVLYAAEKSADLKMDDIKTLLNSGNIYSNLSDDPATQLAQASLVYGLYTGYVNSDAYTGEAVTETDPVQAIKTISSDPLFKNYVDSAQGQADLEAYMAAMDVINDSTSNSDAMKDVLVNGYDSEDLIELLKGVMGK